MLGILERTVLYKYIQVHTSTYTLQYITYSITLYRSILYKYEYTERIYSYIYCIIAIESKVVRGLYECELQIQK